MDELEIGFYSAVAIYGLIFTWTLLVRLRWLPTSFVRMVHLPLNRLGRIPVLGGVVNACRKYSLGLGLVLAILIGVATTYVVMSALWLVYALSFGMAFALGAMAMFGGGDDEDNEADPDGMYLAKHGHDLVHGSSPYADPDRPL